MTGKILILLAILASVLTFIGIAVTCYLAYSLKKAIAGTTTTPVTEETGDNTPPAEENDTPENTADENGGAEPAEGSTEAPGAAPVSCDCPNQNRLAGFEERMAALEADKQQREAAAEAEREEAIKNDPQIRILDNDRDALIKLRTTAESQLKSYKKDLDAHKNQMADVQAKYDAAVIARGDAESKANDAGSVMIQAKINSTSRNATPKAEEFAQVNADAEKVFNDAILQVQFWDIQINENVTDKDGNVTGPSLTAQLDAASAKVAEDEANLYSVMQTIRNLEAKIKVLDGKIEARKEEIRKSIIA